MLNRSIEETLFSELLRSNIHNICYTRTFVSSTQSRRKEDEISFCTFVWTKGHGEKPRTFICWDGKKSKSALKLYEKLKELPQEATITFLASGTGKWKGKASKFSCDAEYKVHLRGMTFYYNR